MGALVFAGSVVENKGCMPWQTAVTTRSGGVFSETTAAALSVTEEPRRSGAGVEPTEP